MGVLIKRSANRLSLVSTQVKNEKMGAPSKGVNWKRGPHFAQPCKLIKTTNGYDFSSIADLRKISLCCTWEIIFNRSYCCTDVFHLRLFIKTFFVIFFCDGSLFFRSAIFVNRFDSNNFLIQRWAAVAQW